MSGKREGNRRKQHSNGFVRVNVSNIKMSVKRKENAKQSQKEMEKIKTI